MRFRLFILVVVCALASGCVTAPPVRPASTSSHLIECSFVMHKLGYCGPAALEVVFNYYGIERNQYEIADKIYRRSIRGTFKQDMVKYARKEGFEITEGPSDLDSVKKYIDSDTPVIAFINLGPKFLWRGHFIVIVGYDDAREAVISHTGFNAYEAIRYKRFKKKWRNNWIMTVKPPPA